MLIDSHAHLTAPSLEEDLDALLERAKQAGIEAIINICTNPSELEGGLTLAKSHPWIYNVAATTPHDVVKEGEKNFERIASHARAGDLVAIGETGLDYHYYPESASIQQDFMRRYLRLAIECTLPIVIHCREAYSDLFKILDEEYTINGQHRPGVLHCFTGTLEEARMALKRGWHLSLSGIVTFKKSEELREVAKEISLEKLLIETDSPYLAPHPYRSRRNEPAYLVETAKVIAELRGLSFEELAKITAENTLSLFNLKYTQTT